MVAQVPYIAFNAPAESEFVDRFDSGSEKIQAIVDRWEGNLEGVYTSLAELVGQAGSSDFLPTTPNPPGKPGSPNIPNPPNVDIEDFSIDKPLPASTLGALNLVTPTLPADVKLPEAPDPLNLGEVQPNYPGPPDPDFSTPPLEREAIPDFETDVVLVKPPDLSTGVNIPPQPPGIDQDVTGIDTTIPDVLSLIGDEPQLEDVDSVAVDPSVFDIPSLQVIPVDTPTPPSVPGSVFSPLAFTSCILDQVCESITTMLVTSQVDVEHQKASYDLVLERENVASQAELGDLTKVWADRGFVSPPGEMFLQDRNIREGIERKARQGHRDIWVKNRELEIQTRVEAIQAGSQLLNAEVNIHQTAQNLALEQAKFVQQQTSLVFSLAVEAAKISREQQVAILEQFRAKLDAKRAQWDAIDSQVKISLSKADLNVTKVRLRESRIAAVKVLVDSIIAKIAADTSLAELSVTVTRGRVDVWRTLVDTELSVYKSREIYADFARAQAAVITAQAQAHETRVRAISSRLETEARLQSTKIEGQLGKVQLFEAQVGAETSRVKSAIDIKQAQAQFFTELARFESARVQAIGQQAVSRQQTISASVQAQSTAYSSRNNSVAASANAQAGYYNAYAAYINTRAAVVRPKFTLYQAQVDAINASFQAEVRASSDEYRQVLSEWGRAIQQKVTAFNAGLSQLGILGQYPAEIVRSALGSMVVSLSSSEQTAYQQSAGYQASLENILRLNGDV